VERESLKLGIFREPGNEDQNGIGPELMEELKHTTQGARAIKTTGRSDSEGRVPSTTKEGRRLERGPG